MRYLVVFLLFAITSCATVTHVEDVTDRTKWLESSEDNPIINVVQKHYSNNDVEIIIKKKLTTDYVKITLRGGEKRISKTTKTNGR